MAAGEITSTAQEEIRRLAPNEFAQFRKLAYEKFGLDLREGKENVVSARLGKCMRALKIASYREYYRHVIEDATGDALIGMIDALTTNHTSFFREQDHFDFLRKTILPELRTRDRLSIWSAACSSGEEPYSIAFCVLQELGIEGLQKLQILATDISTKVLAAARRGIYGSERFRDVQPDELRAFLLRSAKTGRNLYKVRDHVRGVIDFQRLNLMEPFTHGRTFPLIVCRNVMIYFDRQTQQDLVRRLTAVLEPGGYLFIGHAESLNGLNLPLQYVRPAVYRKPQSGGTLPEGGLRL